MLICLCLSMLVATVLIVRSQSPISVQTTCTDEWIQSQPLNFSGVMYRVLTPQEGYSTYQLERSTATGIEITDINIAETLFGKIYPTAVSPNGDYIVW